MNSGNTQKLSLWLLHRKHTSVPCSGCVNSFHLKNKKDVFDMASVQTDFLKVIVLFLCLRIRADLRPLVKKSEVFLSAFGDDWAIQCEILCMSSRVSMD